MTAPRCELINIAGQAGGGCAAANQRFPRLPGASASPRPVAAVCLPRSPGAWDLGLLQLCACRAPLPGHMPAAVHECPGLKLLANLNQSPWFSLEFRSVLFNPGPENTTACCYASPPGKIEPTFDSRGAKETSLLLKRYWTRKRGCFQARQELALSPLLTAVCPVMLCIEYQRFQAISLEQFVRFSEIAKFRSSTSLADKHLRI